MSEVIKKGQMKDILDAINDVNEKNVYPVMVPTLKKNVMFRELTTKQEKMLVKTIVDSPVYNSEFIFAIREIIKDNCVEDINVDDLTIIDKTAILLVMRQKSIGNEFKFTFKETDKSTEIDIEKYVEKFKTVNIPEDEEVGTEDIRVTCGYPTISTEYNLEKEFRTDFAELEIKNVDEARTAIGTVFTNEIVKYIKEVVIKQDETEMVLDMDDFNFADRIEILEKLGNRVLGEIMGYIEHANKEVQEILKVELELEKDEQAKYGSDKLTSILETGSDFFIIS